MSDEAVAAGAGSFLKSRHRFLAERARLARPVNRFDGQLVGQVWKSLERVRGQRSALSEVYKAGSSRVSVARPRPVTRNWEDCVSQVAEEIVSAGAAPDGGGRVSGQGVGDVAGGDSCGGPAGPVAATNYFRSST